MSDVDVALPSADELPGVLLRLAVPHEDINDLVGMLPTIERSAELRAMLERYVHTLVRHMGSIDGPPHPPDPPADAGAIVRYFPVYAFVATLPYVQAFHRERGIPADVSWATLADLGRNMAVHRQVFGTGGLDVGFWLALHFTGKLYALGRLQFERARLGDRTGHAVRAAGLPYGPGDHVLLVHVPAFFGPLTTTACDASFGWAKTFFPAHFPAESYAVAACYSWLLDDQLGEYLSADSNIIRFQRRFRLAHRQDGVLDDETVRFVFGTAGVPASELPRRTRLERAIAGHLDAGRHWHSRAGWLRL